jgi:hypothetical protein
MVSDMESKFLLPLVSLKGQVSNNLIGGWTWVSRKVSSSWKEMVACNLCKGSRPSLFFLRAFVFSVSLFFFTISTLVFFQWGSGVSCKLPVGRRPRTS